MSSKKNTRIIPLRILRIGLTGLILLVLGGGIGYRYHEYRVAVEARNGSFKSLLDRGNLDFTMFWKVWDTLQERYLNPEAIDEQQMIYGAIEGMTASLGDPYTVFLPPKKNQQSKEDLNGEFSGVGIQLGFKRDTLAVIAPLEGHPAIKQGVQAGDLILSIVDEEQGVDVETAGLTLPEAVRYIRGKRGTQVTLGLYREGKGLFDVTITRDTITIPSVELAIGNMEDGKFVKDEAGKVAWMKIVRFGERTQPEWDVAVRKINDVRDQLDGIVVDVRNNPGGFLQSAISLASDFIPEGAVVTQEGRFDSETYTVNRRGRLLGMPLVVLINGGSASASEILAGALRDRLNAPLVGVRSFGKGTVQEAMELPGGAGLHVTTARWLLPSGDWIHEDGLEPTVKVELSVPEDATEAGDILDTQLATAIRILETDVQTVLDEMQAVDNQAK